MSVIGQIFGGMGGKLIESLDGLFTSDEERMNAQAKIDAVLEAGKKDMRDAALKYDAERTKRHEADMKSDSWLSKNVRPSSLIYLLAVVSVLSVTDGNMVINGKAFTVGKEYIALFNDLLLLAFGFYFGSRGVEKVAEKVKEVIQKEPKKKDNTPKPWGFDEDD